MSTVQDIILARVGEMRKEAAAEQAYAEGFCKAAEAMGVDPEALVKAAFTMPKFLGNAVGRAVKGLAGAKKSVRRGYDRYVDLVNGDTARKYQDQISAMDRLMGKMQGAGHSGVISARSVNGKMVPTREGDIWSRALRQKGRYLRKLEDENFLGGLARGGTIAGMAAAPVLAIAGVKGLADMYNRAHGYGQAPQAAQAGQAAQV